MFRRRAAAAIAAVLIAICSFLAVPVAAKPSPPVPVPQVPAGAHILGTQALDLYRTGLPSIHCVALTYGPNLGGWPGFWEWHDIQVVLSCNYPVYYSSTVICWEVTMSGYADSDCYKLWGSTRVPTTYDDNAPHFQVACWDSTLQWGHYYWLYMTIQDPVTGVTSTSSKSSSVHWDYCKGNGS